MSDFSMANGLFGDSGGPPPMSPYVRRRRRPPRERTAILVPLLIGGALAFVTLAGQSRLGQWLRGFLSARDLVTRDRLRRRLHGGASPARVRRTILGKSKAFIAAQFGPPRTAVVAGVAPPSSAPVGQTAFWRADTWYYAFDQARQTAMAVSFQNDIARAVEFFEAPL